nr:uncharacterized protein CTRU02_09736 [Colletotrichum truncatum]KAF6788418.1 hypothetical protein CTRU02_09736 [Colletotrichum truncatum]
MRNFNYQTPKIVALWILSPLGGQASLRIMELAPLNESEDWPFQYLDFTSAMGNRSSWSASIRIPIHAAFAAQSSSTRSIKEAPHDEFGNVKIPLVEPYLSGPEQPDEEGWYKVDQIQETIYASIAGLPFASKDGFRRDFNYSSTIETSYMYSNCIADHHEDSNIVTGDTVQMSSMYHNGVSFDPGSPYTPPNNAYEKGFGISNITDLICSQRLTQLLNTFWIASFANRNATGTYGFGAIDPNNNFKLTSSESNGTRVKDIKVIHANKLWMAALIVASTIMLLAGLVTSALDIGKVALGTVGNLVPLSWQEVDRLYG